MPHGPSGRTYYNKSRANLLGFCVRAKGIEPIRLSALDPKSSLSTNFNTPASFGVTPNPDGTAKILIIIYFANYNPIFLKKSFPLSSTSMKAGKFSTLIFHIASIPSSGYSTHSMLFMLFCARIAAGPPMEPR